MKMTLALTFMILVSLLIPDVSSRELIVTNNQGTKKQHKTTGDGNAFELYYPDLHLPISMAQPEKTKRKIKDMLAEHTKIRDRWLLDVANEDPRAFMPNSHTYWNAVSKRGYLFNIISISFIILAFWVFILRIVFGECGGYKMEVRYSVKSERYILHAINLTGFIIFAIAYGYMAYNMLDEKAVSKAIGKSLVVHNKNQVETAEKVYRYIKQTNFRKLTVMYSSISYDKFRVGNYIKSLQLVYAESLKEARAFREEFFYESSNRISSRALALLFVVGVSVGAFFIGYKKRITLVSMIVSMLLLFVIVFCFDNLASVFNYWSVYVDMCNASVPAFDYGKTKLRLRPDNEFDSLLTCLNPKYKQKLHAQITSLLIAQNSIFIMMKNYFEIEDRGVIMEGLFDSALSVQRNLGKILERLKNSTVANKRSFGSLKKYVQLIGELNQRFDELEKLSMCYELNKWLSEFNNSACSIGLPAYYNIIWGYVWIIVGIFAMVCSMYISESAVQSLKKEENVYVKTKRLRYDWS